MHLENRCGQHQFAYGGTVIQLNKTHATVARIDHAHRIDNTRKPLLVVTRFNPRQRHRGHRLQMRAIRVIRMAAEIESERCLLKRQRLQQLPRSRVDQRYMMHARIVAKQTVL